MNRPPRRRGCARASGRSRWRAPGRPSSSSRAAGSTSSWCPSGAVRGSHCPGRRCSRPAHLPRPTAPTVPRASPPRCGCRRRRRSRSRRSRRARARCGCSPAPAEGARSRRPPPLGGMTPRIFLISFLAAAALAAVATPARAGSYVVVGCSDLRPADGWHLTAGGFPSRDDCRAGGGLYTTSGSNAHLFRFDAPPGTTISRPVTAYPAHLSPAAPWAVPSLGVEAGHAGEWETIPPARGYIGGVPIELGAARVVGAAHAADALRVGVRCDLAGPCVAGGQPWARFYSLAVELSDEHPPTVALSAPARHVRGAVGIALATRDEGGGVYERALDLDGQRLATTRLCTTVPATIGAERHVTSRVPCPLDAPATVPLDTRALTDGAHTLVARAEDVAGNARTALARIVVDNRPPRAGTVVLTGDPGEALTAQPSGFSGEDVSYDYRWERCDDTGCAEIGAAVSRTYSVRPRDAGHRLRAVVIATDGGGSVRAASAQSAPTPAPAAAPAGVPQPRGRLTAWLEHGGRHLRRAAVTWPTRVRIR